MNDDEDDDDDDDDINNKIGLIKAFIKMVIMMMI